MGEAEHAYTRPQSATAGTMPAEFAAYIDGTSLLAKTQAMGVSPSTRRDGRMPLC